MSCQSGSASWTGRALPVMVTSDMKLGPLAREHRSAASGGTAPSVTAPRAPAALQLVWGALVVLMLLEAADELSGAGGPAAPAGTWVHDAVIAASALVILARVVIDPRSRRAWLAIGLAMTTWGVASIAWTSVYGGQVRVPYPTFADALWLSWYPLMAAGIFYLIRDSLPRFEVHRWMDGFAVILVVLIAGFAVVVNPVTDHEMQGTVAKVVDFSYPVLDLLIAGTVIGVYVVLAWRPTRMWIRFGLGTLIITIGDAAFAVQEARGIAIDERYDFVLTLGAVVIASAAWVRGSEVAQERPPITGLRAVALPLLAQAIAAAIQVYGLFGSLGASERVLTLAVLIVSSVQIVLTRPRPEPEVESREPSP